jgi:hypothetical protein
MNCSPPIALLLLSLTAGMFLLYKTQKENLNAFFKVVSWFIIIVSFVSMICSAMHCMMRMRCHMGREECREMEGCEMGMGHGGMNKRVMIYRGEGDGECEMMKDCCRERMECGEGKEECEEGKMDCCKKGGAHECEMGTEKKCDMKKDSVVVKKK